LTGAGSTAVARNCRTEKEKYEDVQTVFAIAGGGSRRDSGGVLIDVLKISRRF
jgi:hypothetical protein